MGVAKSRCPDSDNEIDLIFGSLDCLGYVYTYKSDDYFKKYLISSSSRGNDNDPV